MEAIQLPQPSGCNAAQEKGSLLLIQAAPFLTCKTKQHIHYEDKKQASLLNGFQNKNGITAKFPSSYDS